MDAVGNAALHSPVKLHTACDQKRNLFLSRLLGRILDGSMIERLRVQGGVGRQHRSLNKGNIMVPQLAVSLAL
jgi:hypothetical protein